MADRGQRRLTGKEGKERMCEVRALLAELPDYRNGPCADLRKSLLAEIEETRVHRRSQDDRYPALMDIEANVAAYLAARTRTDRYASFDYCFNNFQSHAERGHVAQMAEGSALEISCLQLGFYLASWGMYRGSTLRLQRSLAYLGPAVAVVATSPRELWSTDANDYSDEVCSLILDVAHRLRAAFPEGASDTLVTKVMLGTFGCVPAFDSYFKRAFGVSKFNRSALGRIAQFYEDNAEVIERNRVPTLDFATGSDTERRYSRAKVIDMIFFVEGAR